MGIVSLETEIGPQGGEVNCFLTRKYTVKSTVENVKVFFVVDVILTNNIIMHKRWRYDCLKIIISLHDFLLDSCQWGEWEDNIQEKCKQTVCGPQNYTRTRTSIKNPLHCNTKENAEKWRTVEECPLNNCAGRSSIVYI